VIKTVPLPCCSHNNAVCVVDDVDDVAVPVVIVEALVHDSSTMSCNRVQSACIHLHWIFHPWMSLWLLLSVMTTLLPHQANAGFIGIGVHYV